MNLQVGEFLEEPYAAHGSAFGFVVSVWALVGQKGCRIVGLGFQILGSASYLSNLEKGP